MIVFSERRSREIQQIGRKLLMDIWARQTIRMTCQAAIEDIDQWEDESLGRTRIRSELKGLRARWRR